MELLFFQEREALTYKEILSFQRATGGIESVAYKKLMAPFKKEMPKSYFDGFRRACADEKYAFLSNVLLARSYLRGKACKLVTLSRPAFRDTYALIISKNSSYKGIINWRWENNYGCLDLWRTIHFVFLAKYPRQKTLSAFLRSINFNLETVWKVSNTFQKHILQLDLIVDS